MHLLSVWNEKSTMVQKYRDALTTSEALLQYSRTVRMYYGRNISDMYISSIVT